MKAYLLFILLFILTGTEAHSSSLVSNANKKEITYVAFNPSRDDEHDKDKKCKKKHKQYRSCRGNSKHNNNQGKCREHDEDDDHCHHSNCDHRRKKGAVVIDFPTVVIPFPSKH